MKFKLFALKDGQKVNWTFDNQTSYIFDENGNQQLLDFPEQNYMQTFPFTRNFNPYKKSQYNWLLEIALGSNCNFHCKYCSQTLYRGQCYNAKPSDVKPFISMLKASGLQCHRIMLWGGEPLVYWKTMELLVPELRAMFPEAMISAPTNGSLLTREKVDFFYKYKMHLYISHDGCENNNDNRIANNESGYSDIFQDPVVLDAIKYASEIMPDGYMAFGTTPTSGNVDCEKIINFFKKKVNDKIKVSTHNIVRCHNSKDLMQVVSSTLSESDLKAYSDSVFKVLVDKNPNDYSLIRRMDYMITTWKNKEKLNNVRAECCIPFSDGLIVDMRGKVLQCHNHAIQDKAYGQLPDLLSINAIGYNQLRNKHRCLNCLVVHGCKGGCPSADDKANELACPNLKALYWGVFRAAMYLTFGIYVYDYEAINENL